LMPGVPVKLQKLLDVQGDGRNFFGAWENAKKWRLVPPGTRVRKGEPLFPRIDLDQLLAEREARDEAEEYIEPIKPEIDIEDFAKLDLRVVKILAAEKVPKTDKLIKLTVKLGAEERVVVSGIAQHYKPEDLVGRSVVLVANLKPAKLRGIVSQGMVLAASHEGSLEVLSLDHPMPPGAGVK